MDARPGWYITRVTFTIEIEREEDGRWIAEVPALPGVLCYGRDRDEAVAGVQALALSVIAERALQRIGWAVKGQSGSHRTLSVARTRQ